MNTQRRQPPKPSVIPFGYVLDEDGQIAINLAPYRDFDKTYYAIARELVESFLKTESVDQTLEDMCDLYGTERVGSHHLDFPRHPKALKYWLLNPFLRGRLVFNLKDPQRRIEYLEHHPAIITEEEARQIYSIMKRQKVVQKADLLVNPMAGLIFCAGCGSPMKVSQSRDGTNSEYHCYLVCKGAYPKAGKPRICDRRSSYGLEISDVMDIVIEAIIGSSDRLLQPSDDADEFVKTPEMVKLEDNLRRMEALGLPELQEVIEQEKTKLEDLMAVALEQVREDKLAFENLRLMISRPNFWKYSTPEDLREILPLLVKKVICDLGRVTVELLF